MTSFVYLKDLGHAAVYINEVLQAMAINLSAAHVIQFQQDITNCVMFSTIFAMPAYLNQYPNQVEIFEAITCHIHFLRRNTNIKWLFLLRICFMFNYINLDSAIPQIS